jgi:hypothetical protein
LPAASAEAQTPATGGAISRLMLMPLLTPHDKFETPTGGHGTFRTPSPGGDQKSSAVGPAHTQQMEELAPLPPKSAQQPESPLAARRALEEGAFLSSPSSPYSIARRIQSPCSSHSCRSSAAEGRTARRARGPADQRAAAAGGGRQGSSFTSKIYQPLVIPR